MDHMIKFLEASGIILGGGFVLSLPIIIAMVYYAFSDEMPHDKEKHALIIVTIGYIIMVLIGLWITTA